MSKRGLLQLLVLTMTAMGSYSVDAALIQQDLTEISNSAGEIVIGTVENQYAEIVDADKGIIHTFSEVFVDHAFKGFVRSNEVVIIETLGGEVGEHGLWVSDQPRILIGERGIFFLNLDQVRDVYSIVGSVQGKFTMEEDWVVEMDVHIRDFVGMMTGALPIDNGGPGVRACTVDDLGITWPNDTAAMYWNKSGTGDCPAEGSATRRGAVTWNNVSGSSPIKILG